MGVIKRYMAFVTPYKKQIALTMVIGMIKFSIPLTLPLLLKYVIDDVIQGSGTAEEKTSSLLMIMGIMLFLFLIMRPPVEYYRQYYAQWTGSKVLFDIREKLFSHIQKLSLRYYANTRTGEIISRVINDVEQTKEFVITGLMNIWLDMMTVLIVIAIMCTLDIKLTIVSVIIFPLYAFAVKYFYGRLRKLTKERSQALAEVQGHLHERVQGMPVIRSFAIEEYEQENFHDENKNFLNKAINHTNWNAKTFAVVNTITDIAPLLIIAFAGYTVINGSLSIGTMIAFVGYIDRMYSPIRRLINSSTTLTQSIASMDRIFEFIDEPYEVTDRPNAKEANHLKGEVEFKNVSFRYENTQEEILHNISLKVEQGQTIALVGMSGGGKSTLVSLIPRFYDVTKGSLEMDGIDIKEYKVRSLRNHVGMVLQDTFLFSDTIKENIAVGNPEASFDEIVSAAKAANAHQFIMSLPEGYDTKVGERGVKLSGGQKQRISIARVFLKNPPLLILDEATSALDLESEHYIQEAMQKLAKDRTTFIVAHRLSTITHADQIVVMEKGEIVEKGTHEELMNRGDSHYRHLFSIQTLN
ncbi:ABC transporter ATP-binding protein [Bacillus sp. NPDC093026]|uniref:ABC transporter ATP-binding protein n=1 Tax=Bacillus sp. NPDC093026 TaxID=3363948 RepID=UPI00380A60D5